jgi:endoglucanase
MYRRRTLGLLAAATMMALGAATVARSISESGAANPFAAAPFFVDPGSAAARQARVWRRSRPSWTRAMRKIAAQPQADWFTNPDPAHTYGDVRRHVLRIAAAGKLPVLVAYAIPARDCGSYSSGGARSALAYRRWIRRFAAGIGRHSAAVILEPDALPELECLDANARQARLASLRDAVAVLSAKPGVGVYLDAGQSAWRSVPTMVARLRAAGVGRARGFSLNVASYWPTAAQIPYGNAIAVALGGKHYVVDTSRNGRGPLQRVWCNPPGRGLGDRPTTATASPFADAYFWIKRPGESDGSCNGGPSAGQWWPEYALGLARRAAY